MSILMRLLILLSIDVYFDTLQQLHAHERDYKGACDLLSVGAEYAGSNDAEYTKILFLLSKGMVRNIILFRHLHTHIF